MAGLILTNQPGAGCCSTLLVATFPVLPLHFFAHSSDVKPSLCFRPSAEAWLEGLEYKKSPRQQQASGSSKLVLVPETPDKADDEVSRTFLLVQNHHQDCHPHRRFPSLQSRIQFCKIRHEHE